MYTLLFEKFDDQFGFFLLQVSVDTWWVLLLINAKLAVGADHVI